MVQASTGKQSASSIKDVQVISTNVAAQAAPTNASPPVSDEENMSDDEDSAMLMRMESSDVSLPRAPVKQLIMEKLPPSAKMHQQSKDLITNLCMHFLMQLSEESNEFCNAQNKKTVCPDHVLDALSKMNLTRYFTKLAGLEKEQLAKAAATGKRQSRSAAAALEKRVNETLRDPKKLRVEILKRLNASMDGGMKAGRIRQKGKEEEDDKLTDEQKKDEQEKLFLEARQLWDKEQEQQKAIDAQQAAVNDSQQQFAGQLGDGDFPQDGVNGEAIQQQVYDGQEQFDNYDSIDQQEMMQQPVFNPIEYFRDMIYMSDFLNDVAEQEQQPLQADPNVAADTPAAVTGELGDQHAQYEDAQMNMGVAPGLPDYGDDFEMVAAGFDSFEFDADDVGAFQAANEVARNEDDTKPKEQNDQEMRQEGCEEDIQLCAIGESKQHV